MTTVDNSPSDDRFSRPGPVARRVLSVCAGVLALVCLLLAVASLGRGGWSNERTILYAAEGGLISPRESLMHGLFFGVAMVIWIVVWASAMAAPNLRANRIFRASVAGSLIVLGTGTLAGVLCRDLAGMLVVGAVVAMPIALVAVVARRWSRFAG